MNSTLACTLVGAKLGIKVAHLEAGLRSRDRTMPEEINRIATDALADVLWTPSPDADANLLAEGVAAERIERVGNIMIDSLELLRKKIEYQKAYDDFGLEAGSYGVVTLHRPSNVDDPSILQRICGILKQIADTVPLVFPIHPRTRQRIEANHLQLAMGNKNKLFMPEPLNYVRFMNLVFNCRFVITDSGGIQEETSYLGIPCLTVRINTERPITITHGTNQLCDFSQLGKKVDGILHGQVPQRKNLEFWDGKTAVRIVNLLREDRLELMKKAAG